MLICLPCHLIMHALTNVFGMGISLNPVKKKVSKEHIDTVEEDGKCRMFSFKSSRGISYVANTCTLQPTLASFKDRVKQYCMSTDILLVHGAYSNSTAWYKVMLDMTRKGHTVHAIDLPGFGKSDFSDELLSLSTEDLVEELAEFILKCLNLMNIKKAILVGHSFGGFVCTIALSNSELRSRVKALTLVAPAGLFPVGGNRWGHLHAVIFRLKMLSFISPDMQSRGENLVRKFLDTGLYGSRWVYPSLPILLKSTIPCTVMTGTSDPIFTVDHGLLLHEITNGSVAFKPVILSDHYLADDSIIQNAVVQEIYNICHGPICPLDRKKQPYVMKRNQMLADEIRVFNTSHKSPVGIENGAFTKTFTSYRAKMMELCNKVESVLASKTHPKQAFTNKEAFDVKCKYKKKDNQKNVRQKSPKTRKQASAQVTRFLLHKPNASAEKQRQMQRLVHRASVSRVNDSITKT